MSRSGYSEDYGCDDQWELIRYRGAVTSAIKGARGQAFLKDLLAALDAMPEKRLVHGYLEQSGEVCALGAIGRARGLDLAKFRSDPDDDSSTLNMADALNIAKALAREIVFENDDALDRCTPEVRFSYMRQWVAAQIKEPIP